MSDLLMNEYQKLAMRTDSFNYDESNPQSLRLLNGLMGLNGEAGEAIDIYKKAMFQGHDIDIEEIIEELGDVLWYIALSADAISVSLDEIARLNIAKLRKRYPEGFSTEDSIERRDHDPNGEPDMPKVRDES